jgi:hypothetical protein
MQPTASHNTPHDATAQEPMMTFPTTNSALIRRLADLFKACSIEETVSYDQLSKTLGAPIIGRLYFAHRAMELANAECGAIFVNVKLLGYKRLPHDEAHALGAHARRRGRRIFRQASKKIGNVLIIANDISNEARLKAYSEQASLGLLLHMTYDRNKPVIPEGAAAPPTHETVRASVEALRAARTRQFG